ncbi:hypothetical protein HAPAU_29530 [Halalkalicoccus paucihalophilus]|uniref:Uncharacterized protein n=1 Tax=Halalkalicoccus paucihalophilus TaxID=1008153 RepID=A0A151ABE3_9EURY|nr:hypothetical protein HAPAU_29530 [Halalkalicoccus paucihalophilus]
MRTTLSMRRRSVKRLITHKAGRPRLDQRSVSDSLFEFILELTHRLNTPFDELLPFSKYDLLFGMYDVPSTGDRCDKR